MHSGKDILLGKLRGNIPMTGREQVKLTMLLALPAILAQLSMCLMSYIDAAMVGRLGNAPAAAVGLVSTTVWIFGSFCYANSSGFSVQIAHRCGAGDFDGARRIFRKGLLTVLSVSLLLAAIGIAVSGPLPTWLGGSAEIRDDASGYFRIYSMFIPVFQTAVFCEAALIASGNVKVPSIVSMVMCALDVLFNWLFIFVLDYGVRGAAIGTGLSEVCAAAFLLVYATRHSTELKQGRHWGWLFPTLKVLGDKSPRVEYKNADALGNDSGSIYRQALRISWPLWLQNIVVRGAYIAATVLVAPLGTVAIAANSFAIIAEGFCYLPGYGMQDAASTLVGQSLGSGRKDLARRFARITIFSGAAMMTALAVLMWLYAPGIMGLLTHDGEVIALGAKCLRIEAWAELFYAISIVGNGCCTGAGDTLVPSFINLLSMWAVRIVLALILIPRMGLEGYWTAMAVELSFKGLLFAARIHGSRWMKTKLTESKI